MIECIMVDGGSNKGPSYLEVQFWWTLRHIEAPTSATLVTTKNSGSNYLNRVELQNGCLACAHANLFIPLNLNGLYFSPETGKVDMNHQKKRMILTHFHDGKLLGNLVWCFCAGNFNKKNQVSYQISWIQGNVQKYLEMLVFPVRKLSCKVSISLHV